MVMVLMVMANNQLVQSLKAPEQSRKATTTSRKSQI